MQQKKSLYGNINTEGQPGAPSNLYNNRMPAFLDEVEEGIRPVVAACIRAGLDTFSSCAGHKYPPGVAKHEEVNRFVDVVIEERDVPRWNNFVASLRVQSGLHFGVIILRDDISPTLINNRYDHPVRCKIVYNERLGPVTEQMNQILIRAFEEGRFPREGR